MHFKLSLLIATLFCCHTFLRAQEKENLISLSMKDASLKEILKEIEKQSPYSFVYNESINLSTKKSISLKNKLLESALLLIFDGTNIEWKISGNHILLQQAAKTFTISGYVMDQKTKETLIGSSIYSPNIRKGTVSNNYGFYSISLPAGEINLKASYVGYSMNEIHFILTKDTVINLSMTTSAMLQEVIVETNKGILSNIENTQLGAINLTAKTINAVPTIFGETDLIKVLQQTPGVSAGTDGLSGLYVRGGNRDENLYLLDGNPLYDVNHVFGIFSTFNPDAIKNMEFYKGSFPARYGGRLSSVVDVRTKDGDMQEYHGTATIGLIASKAQVEGPIIKDKASFNVSFRRTYLDVFTTPYFWIMNRKNKALGEKHSAGYHFYDLNAKLNYKFSDKSRIYLNIYGGEDALKARDESTYNDENYDSYSNGQAQWNWGNKLASFNWNYVFNSQLFGNINLMYSKFNSNINVSDKENYTEKEKSTNEDILEYYYHSGIQDFGVRTDFNYTPHPDHYIRFGSNYLYHHFMPEKNGTSSRSLYDDRLIEENIFDYNGEKIYAHDFYIYAEDEITLSSRWKVNAGLNLSLFHVQNKNYTNLHPRLSTRYLINESLSAKASYTIMNQYIHQLSSSRMSLPTDIWIPVTKNIKPMISQQTSAGIYYQLNKEYDFSLESYYKTMDNLIEYKDGAPLLSSSVNWQDRIAVGKGKSYGLELLMQKSTGKISGWISYGLSWTDRQFPGGEINDGKRFWAKYDNRHKINIVGMWRIKKNLELNAAWTYHSGNRMSVGLERYETAPVMPGYSPNNIFAPGGGVISYFNERNNYKMPDYHRLDIGINFYRPKDNGRMGIWNVSVYNVYCRLNPIIAYPNYQYYGYSVHDEATTSVKPTLTGFGVLPILPSISYTYKF